MNKKVVVKESKVHGKGVFALKDIKKGEKVLEYIGKKVSKEEGDAISEKHIEKAKKNPSRGAVYVFELNDKYDINGDVPENIAKYINHSCSPNCETEVINNKIWIIARKNIKEGDEISYDYGYSLEDYSDHPCRCGSKNCVGFIVDSRKRKKLLEKLGKR